MMLLFLAKGPVLGQSKKEVTSREVLSKAIKIYRQNPYPAFKGNSLHVHPFLGDSTVNEYYSGYNDNKFNPIKYYSSDRIKNKIGLDSVYSWGNKGEYLHLTLWQVKVSVLRVYDIYDAMPSSFADPLEILLYFYIKNRKLTQYDTIINGEQCYRFEYLKDNTIDPLTGLQVTNRKEFLTLSWLNAPIKESIRIMEYGYYEEWDGDPYKYDYQFTYLDDSTWQKHMQGMDSEIALYFVGYTPSENVKKEKSKLQVGDTIQYWHFKQLGGDSIDIRSLNRDFYVLDFWYTSCGPCVGAIPNNNRLDSTIRQYNAQVLGITTAHKSDVFLEAFKEKRSIQYALFTYSGTGLESHFPVRAYPTYILVNRDGCILHIGVGSYRLDYKQEIEDKIKEEIVKEEK